MSKKGIYVEMAHHPQAILDAMAGMEGAVARASTVQQALKYLVGAAGLLIAAAFALAFAVQQFDLPVELCLLSAVFFVIAAVGGVLSAFSGRWRAPLLQEHFDAAHQVLHALRDDTGRKGRVVGWLDLSGPMKEEKEVRTARSGGGKRKIYYRDPWFRAKFKLVDGNVLRLTLEDKVKTKAGSIVRHESQFSAKLVVDPARYRLSGVDASDYRHYYTEILQGYSGKGTCIEDGIFAVRGTKPANDFAAQPVLETLKTVYGHLYDRSEPIRSGPSSVGIDKSGPGGVT